MNTSRWLRKKGIAIRLDTTAHKFVMEQTLESAHFRRTLLYLKGKELIYNFYDNLQEPYYLIGVAEFFCVYFFLMSRKPGNWRSMARNLLKVVCISIVIGLTYFCLFQESKGVKNMIPYLYHLGKLFKESYCLLGMAEMVGVSVYFYVASKWPGNQRYMV